MILDEDTANEIAGDEDAMGDAYYDCDNQCTFYYVDGNYTVTVTDEDGNVVWTGDSIEHGVPLSKVCEAGYYLMVNDYYNWWELEGEFEADEPFDPSKLKTIFMDNSDVLDITPLNTLWYGETCVDMEPVEDAGHGKEFTVIVVESVSEEDYKENNDGDMSNYEFECLSSDEL